MLTFDEIYAKYETQVSAMVRGTYLPTDLQQDIKQNVFAEIHRTLERGWRPNSPQHMDAMVITITSNKVQKMERDTSRRKNREKTSVLGSDVADFQFDQQPWSDERDDRWEELDRLAAHLPEPLREVVELRVAGHGRVAIAKQLGLRPDTVSMRLTRATRRLREMHLGALNAG